MGYGGSGTAEAIARVKIDALPKGAEWDVTDSASLLYAYSVKALYYFSECIRAVAEQQAASVGPDSIAMTESAKSKAHAYLANANAEGEDVRSIAQVAPHRFGNNRRCPDALCPPRWHLGLFPGTTGNSA